MIKNIADFEIFKTPNNKYNEVLNSYVNENAYLSIVSTNRCKLNCSYCINSKTDQSLELPLEKAVDNIKKLIKITNIKELVILGGEPLEYSKIKELVLELSKLNLNKICITVSAYALVYNKELIKILAVSGITHLNISLHNDNVPVDICKVEEVINALKLINFNLKIRINTNIYRKNLDNIDSLLNWVNRLQLLNIDSVRLSNIIYKDSFSVNNKNTKDSKVLTDASYNNLFDALINYYTDNYTIFNNLKTLGFVDYSLIPLKIPIIVNRNIDSSVSDQICENKDSIINTFKCLVTGDISLSWNENNIINL